MSVFFFFSADLQTENTPWRNDSRTMFEESLVCEFENKNRQRKQEKVALKFFRCSKVSGSNRFCNRPLIDCQFAYQANELFNRFLLNKLYKARASTSRVKKEPMGANRSNMRARGILFFKRVN